MQHVHLGAKGAEDSLPAARGGAPAQIQHDPAAVQADRAHALQQPLLVVRQQIRARLQTPIGAEAIGQRHDAVQARFDRLLLLLAQLGAAGTEDLDAVVVGRVVAGGHHQAAASPQLTDGTGNGGGGAEADVEHLAAGGGESRRQRRHKHRPAAARVHAQHDRTTLRQLAAAPEAKLQRQGRRDQLAHPTADAVGAEPGRTRRQWCAEGVADQLSHRKRAAGVASR